MIICPIKDLGRYAPIIPGLEEALAVVNSLTDYTPRTIPLSGKNRILVQQNTTKPAGNSEAHWKFLDIQCIVKGSETMGWADVATLTPANDFNEDKDVGLYSGHLEFVKINQGNCYVVFPEDAHAPGVHLDTPTEFTKLVIKLAL